MTTSRFPVRPPTARLGGAVALSVLVVACSGGGGSVTPRPPAAPAHTTQQTASVTINVKWGAPSTSSSTRRPRYVPMNTQSIAITVNGGSPQILNAPAPSTTIVAPVANDTFTFTAYDEQGGAGNALSRATVSQTIALDTANVVAATLNGIPASLAISLANPALNAGTPGSTAINVVAKDADGNVIVGPGGYQSPVQLSIFDPANTGTLSLSTAVLQNQSSTATLNYNGGTLAAANVVASVNGVPPATALFAPKPTVYEFSVGSAVGPRWIAAGPDGNMWFTEVQGNAVGSITPSGMSTAYPLPSAASIPLGIVAGSDGRLWFAEDGTSKIGAITTRGALTEYATVSGAEPVGVVDRGDGNIWYTDANPNGSHVGYESEFASTSNTVVATKQGEIPAWIATAPDNNVYFTETNDRIGRVANLGGAITEVQLTYGAAPSQIVRGPDGNLWFTETGLSRIGRLSPSSFTVTGEFPTPTPNASPLGITVGADGALWFTEFETNSGVATDKIGRITTGGVFTEFSMPSNGLGLMGIAASPDGSIWVCENQTDRIARLVY